MKKVLFILFSYFLTGNILYSQPVASPELRCLSVVMPSGAVNLTWTVPPDPGGTFVAYHIYRNGSFQQSIFNRLTNTWTDVNAMAQNQSECYYIETESFTGVPVVLPAVDTLCSIYLDVTNPGTSIANLVWNAPRTPLLPSMSTWYKIYCDYPAPGTFVDSTQALTYLDTMIVCNRFVSYNVQLSDNLPCVNISNVDGDLFKDNTPPATPVIDSVSVNATNNAEIGWQPSGSPDATAYVIYQNINSVWVPIDTVYGFSTTLYGNPNSSADLLSEWYSVASMDSCGNLSPLSNYHNTIYLTAVVDPCARTADLSWNQYINWASGVGTYEIWVSVNAGPYTLASTNSSSQLTYTYPGLISGSAYCFMIRAKESGGSRTSSSNTRCVVANLPVMPVFTYDQTSTVISPGTVRVEGYTDINASANAYRFERADSPSGPFSIVGTVPYSGNALVSFNDATALTETQSHYYRIITIDSCNQPVQTSNLTRTIHAVAVANSDMTNTLTWNDYEGFDGGVLNYDIYRSVDGSPFIPIGSVNFGTNVYVDDAEPFLTGSGRFEYYVIANEGPGNQYSIISSAASNIAEALQPARFFVPNAFVPGGVNTLFIPNGSFYDKSEYSMEIFNRWGGKIFETDDPYTGWDGTYKGDMCQQGVYVWFIKYKNALGDYTEIQGTVTLIGK